MLILQLCDLKCFVFDMIKLVIHYFEHAIKGFHSFFVTQSIEFSLLLFVFKHFGIAFFLKLLCWFDSALLWLCLESFLGFNFFWKLLVEIVNWNPFLYLCNVIRTFRLLCSWELLKDIGKERLIFICKSILVWLITVQLLENACVSFAWALLIIQVDDFEVNNIIQF